MYAKFYNLIEPPFPVTPDSKYLFLSDGHKEALATIVYGIESRRGFIAIVGEVGTGKTTILRAYLNAIEKKDFSIIYIFNPEVTYQELIVLIAEELGIAVDNSSSAALVNRIHRALIAEYENNRTVVLIIDEAQNMPIPTLESLRMLSNIETEQNKLLQIVLVGQTELEETLALHELRQLNQRIAVKSKILPLSDEDSRRYIEERLEAASLNKQQVFEPAAIKEIIRFAGGIPRAINIACDTALINGFGHGVKPITDKIVKESLATLSSTPNYQTSAWKPKAAGVVGALLVALIVWMLIFDSPVARQNEIQDKASNSNKALISKPAFTAPSVRVDATIEGQTATVMSDNNPDMKNLNQTEPVNLPISSEDHQSADQVTRSLMPNTLDNTSDVVASTNRTRSFQLDKLLSPSDKRTSIKWDPTELSDQGFPVVRTIITGDIASQLCLDIYGFASQKLYEFLLASNPVLMDVNDVPVGETMTFPALTDELQIMRSAYIKIKLRKRKLRRPIAGTQGVTE